MKLVHYEWQKIVSHRLFWVATAALLLLILLDTWRPWSNADAMRREVTAEAGALYTFLETADEEEVARYLARTPDAPPRFLPNAGKENWAVADYRRFVATCADTVATRRQFAETARQLGRVALAGGDDYGVRRNIAIVTAYSVERPFGVRQTDGWDAYFSYAPDDICVLLLVLLAVILSATTDRAAHAHKILYTTPNGRGATLAAKLAAVSLTALLLTLLFTAINLLGVYARYGLWTWSAPLYAVACMAATPLNVTVGQAVGLAAVQQGLGAVLVGCMLTCVTVAFGHRPRALIAAGGAIGLVWTLCGLCGNAPFLNMWSVCVWRHPVTLLATFRDVDIGGYSVPTSLWYAGTWLLMDIALFAVARVAVNRAKNIS